MKIVVTGADGFIGRNLVVRLGEAGCGSVVGVGRSDGIAGLRTALVDADFVFHLAGVNRPPSEEGFAGNVDSMQVLCDELRALGRAVPVVFASSTQAAQDNAYGRSKRAAEALLDAYALATGATVHNHRLTNVFGKWCRPDYNSVVATFCNQVAHGRALSIRDPVARLRLLYVDDLIDCWLNLLKGDSVDAVDAIDRRVFETTLGELAATIERFAASRTSLVTERVGRGLERALYATYVSYLPFASFAYEVPCHADPRGVFVEMLKTPDCGQFSYFTAHPGVTRGEHYHHSKTEKFLVIKGTARFAFRHIDSGEVHALESRGGSGQIVETVPGWTHNIKNIGDDELIVMLWANEIFDRERPDTYALKVEL